VERSRGGSGCRAGKHARRESCSRRLNEAGQGAQKGGGGPDGGVGVYIEDPLKVAGPGRLLGGTVEDGVFECLGGTLVTGAGGRGVVVPAGVGAEVAFPRSHLVEAARGALV